MLDIILMAVWVLTAPVLIYTRWGGTPTLFYIVLAVNTVAWIVFTIKNWDFGE